MRHFGGQSGTENELFMIIKLDVASSAVSPLNTIFFLTRVSLQVSIYCNLCTDFNDWNKWLHSTLLVEFRHYTENTVTDDS